MEKITTVKIDLATNVFLLHEADAHGTVALKRTGRRSELVPVVPLQTPQ